MRPKFIWSFVFSYKHFRENRFIFQRVDSAIDLEISSPSIGTEYTKNMIESMVQIILNVVKDTEMYFYSKLYQQNQQQKEVETHCYRPNDGRMSWRVCGLAWSECEQRSHGPIWWHTRREFKVTIRTIQSCYWFRATFFRSPPPDSLDWVERDEPHGKMMVTALLSSISRQLTQLRLSVFWWSPKKKSATRPSVRFANFWTREHHPCSRFLVLFFELLERYWVQLVVCYIFFFLFQLHCKLGRACFLI